MEDVVDDDVDARQPGEVLEFFLEAGAVEQGVER